MAGDPTPTTQRGGHGGAVALFAFDRLEVPADDGTPNAPQF